MARQFQKHYTREEAQALLPQIRKWLKQTVQLRAELEKADKRISALAAPGRDLGGPIINKWVSTLADIKQVLLEFQRREIQIKDLERGLIDFPAIIGGKEVFLC